MPRVGGGDGGSGPQRTGGAGGFGGWLGGAARAVTGGGVGGGYVVLGGTRYGLRISQVSFILFQYSSNKQRGREVNNIGLFDN